MKFDFKKNCWQGLICIGLLTWISLFMYGCQGMGYRRGWKDYEHSNIERKNVRTWSYPYGYMRGWNARQWKHAQDNRWKSDLIPIPSVK